MTGPMPGLETKSSGLTVFLSFLAPGAGHLYLGKIVRGVVMLLVTICLYRFTYYFWGEFAAAADSS